MSEMADRFAVYLAGRDRERLERAEEMFAALTEREQHLVREAAVMGFVQGRMAHDEQPHPADSTILVRTLLGADAHGDLYPTLTARPQ